MKVSELVEHLKLFDNDLEIYLAADSEGNSYAPLQGTLGHEIPYFITTNGDLYNKEDLENELEELSSTAIPCVVFWPMD